MTSKKSETLQDVFDEIDRQKALEDYYKKIRKAFAWANETETKKEERKMCKDCEGCNNSTLEGAFGAICKAISNKATSPLGDVRVYPIIDKYETCPWPSKRVEKKPKLKACPFCGGNAGWWEGMAVVTHRDNSCPLMYKRAHLRCEIADVEEWNKRYE
jgi:RNA polymerase subunit RPABC4/transcription elongation factor Spt4